MVKKINLFLIYLSFFSILVPPDVCAGVHEEMQGIFTVESLRRYYETNGIYKKRYVLHEMPAWLKLRGYSEPPAWLREVLPAAINSNEPMLIMEAAFVTGLYKYGYSEITMPLLSKYLDAYTLFAADAQRVRTAIAQAFMQMSGPSTDSIITVMLMAKPRYLQSPDFILLLSSINTQGCSICIHTVNTIRLEINEIVKKLEKDSSSSPREKLYYRNLLGIIKGSQGGLSQRSINE